jgi:RTX calcium-binding nonapeptide repeat (4 copies)
MVGARCSRKCLLAAAAVWLGAALPAHAGTVGADLIRGPSSGKGPGPLERRVTYTASDGEENRLVVHLDAAGAHFRDAMEITPGPGCERPSGRGPTEVVCPGVLDHLVVELRDRDDSLSSDIDTKPARGAPGSSAISARITGGEGNDELSASGTLDGGPGDDQLKSRHQASMTGGPGVDTMLGGPGIDTASYENHTASVNADLDGLADDGEHGQNELISAEVENLVGGSGDDVLTGNGRDNLLAGGAGSDVLDAGPGHDYVDGDEGSNVISGGPGWDTLFSGDAGTRVSGGSGNDAMYGTDGPDVFDGGPGQDSMMTHGGNDRLIAADGRRDELSCRRGWRPRPGDVAVIDEHDWPGNCGTIHRSGIARLVHINGSLRLRNRTFFVDVGCPADAGSRCIGSVRLLRGRRSVAHARFRIRAGAEENVERRLSRRARRLVRRFSDERRLRVRFRTRDAHGRMRVLQGSLYTGFLRGTGGASDLANRGRPVSAFD